MPTFIVRFAGGELETFSGRVVDVRSGEKAVFSSAQQLLAFFERMNALGRRMPEETGPRPSRPPG